MLEVGVPWSDLRGLASDGNITRVARNLGFAQKKRCYFWPFSLIFLSLNPVCLGQKKGRKNLCSTLVRAKVW